MNFRQLKGGCLDWVAKKAAGQGGARRKKGKTIAKQNFNFARARGQPPPSRSAASLDVHSLDSETRQQKVNHNDYE